MNDIILSFINSKENKAFSLLQNKVIFNQKKNINLVNFQENESQKRNNFIIKKYHQIYQLIFQEKEIDNKSIKKLENNIIETFTFLKQNNLISSLFPPKINFRFLRDTYKEQKQYDLEQLKDKKTINKKYEQYADSKGRDNTLNNESVINISTEHVREINYLNDKRNGKFLLHMKKNIPLGISENSIFFNKNKQLNNSHKVITELVILHELGHLISSKKLTNTIINDFRKWKDDFPIVKKIIQTNNGEKEIEINHLNNICGNILEGFSDCFAIYLTQKHYSSYDIIENYEKSRQNTSGISGFTINDYDLKNIFDPVSKLQSKHIDLLIDDFFNIAINNSINITKNLIDTHPTFEKEIKTQFEYYCNDLNIQLNLNKSLIENIEEQLKKACLSNFNLTNTNQINFNIHQIRNNSINNSNNNNLKP